MRGTRRQGRIGGEERIVDRHPAHLTDAIGARVEACHRRVDSSQLGIDAIELSPVGSGPIGDDRRNRFDWFAQTDFGGITVATQVVLVVGHGARHYPPRPHRLPRLPRLARTGTVVSGAARLR